MRVGFEGGGKPRTSMLEKSVQNGRDSQLKVEVWEKTL